MAKLPLAASGPGEPFSTAAGVRERTSGGVCVWMRYAHMLALLGSAGPGSACVSCTHTTCACVRHDADALLSGRSDSLAPDVPFFLPHQVLGVMAIWRSFYSTHLDLWSSVEASSVNRSV